MTESILYSTSIHVDDRFFEEGDRNLDEIKKKIPPKYYAEAFYEILRHFQVELRYQMGEGRDSGVYKLTQEIDQIDPDHKLAIKIYRWEDKKRKARTALRGDCLALQTPEIPHAVLPKAVITYNSVSDMMYVKLRDAEFQKEERICASFSQAIKDSEELFEIVCDMEGLGLTLSRYLCKQLLDALVILEEENLMHRDLKLDNFLVSRDWDLYLIDWGFLKRLKSMKKTGSFCGTPHFAAPEVLRHKPYNTKAEVYSFGVCFYCMMTGLFYLPFDEANIANSRLNVKKFEQSGLSFVRFIKAQGWWKWGEDPDLQDFLNQTIDLDVESRPTFKELSLHPLFQNVERPDTPFPKINTQEKNKKKHSISPPTKRKHKS